MFLNNEQNFDPYFNHFIVLKNDQKRFKKRSPREEIEENEKRRCGKTATRSQKHRPLAHSRKRSVKPRYDNAFPREGRIAHLSTLRGRGCMAAAAAARGLCDGVLGDGGVIRTRVASLHHLISSLLLLVVKLQQLLLLLLQLLLLEAGLRQPHISPSQFYHIATHLPRIFKIKIIYFAKFFFKEIS